MTRIEQFIQEVRPFFEEYIQEGNIRNLEDYLATNSGLPGPRGNLELAEAFACVATGYFAQEADKTWELCSRLVSVDAAKAPTNDPGEFLAFCGTLGLAWIGASTSSRQSVSMEIVRQAAKDPRWRLREAAAMGLQRMIELHAPQTLLALQSWINDGDHLEMRAVAAAVAEPRLLMDLEVARQGLQLHYLVTNRLALADDRKTGDFRTLRQSLGYSWSVIVAALPQEGFAALWQLSHSGDPDLCWIVRQNPKKNRLVKSFPEQVITLQRELQADLGLNRISP